MPKLPGRRVPILFALLLGLGAALALACRDAGTGVIDAAATKAIAQADGLRSSGKLLEALAAYRALAKTSPALSERVAHGLGATYAALRRWDEADAALAPYLRAHPEDTDARLVHVSALLGRGDAIGAQEAARTLSAEQPKHLRVQLIAAAFASDPGASKAALKRLSAVDLAPQQAIPSVKRVQPPYDLFAVRAELLRQQGDENAAAAAEEEAQRAEVVDPTATTTLAEVYQRTGQLAIAERLLQRVIALESVATAALRSAAEIALELDKPARALSLLGQIPAQASVEPVDALLRGRARLALGDSAQATTDLQALVTKLEKGEYRGLAARARVWLSRALAKQGQLDAARAALAAPMADPQLEQERVVAIAEIALAAGQPQAAIAELNTLAGPARTAIGPQLLLASAHVKAGAHAEAERVVRELAQRRPDDPRVSYMLATVLERTNGVAALTEYRRSLEMAPGSTAPLVRLVALLDEKGDASGADQLIREQIAAAPQIDALQRLLGERLEQRGDLDGAEAAFKASVSAGGDSDSARIDLADFYGRTGRPTRAVEILDNVLTRTPDDPRALVRAAAALKNLGRRDAAIARYEQALAVAPSDLGAQNNLALLLAADPAQRDRALALAQSASAAAPSSPLIQDTLGYVRLVRGETQLALALLKQSAAQLPKHAEVQQHLGLALLKAGDTEAARHALARARSLDPKLPSDQQELLKLGLDREKP